MTENLPVLAIAPWAISALLGLGAWHDLATRTIPDSISVGTALIGLAARLSEGCYPACVSIGFAILLFFCLVPLNARGLFGGADIKLMAALAIGLSPLAMTHLLLVVSMFGAGLALLYLGLPILFRARPPRTLPIAQHGRFRRVVAVERYRITHSRSLPYGVAIAAGGILSALFYARV